MINKYIEKSSFKDSDKKDFINLSLNAIFKCNMQIKKHLYF
jgi:hypothetical protein